MFFKYPNDEIAYKDYEQDFMVADIVKVTPLLNKTATSIESYFPQGDWLDLNTMSILSVNESKMVNLTVGDSIAHYLAPGALIPIVDDSDSPIMTASDIIKHKTRLLINPNDIGMAYGSIFVDDGNNMTSFYIGEYEYWQFQVSAKSIHKYTVYQNEGFGTNMTNQNRIIKDIVITGADKWTSQANLFACAVSEDMTFTDLPAAYDDKTKMLTITPSDDLLYSGFRDIYYGSVDNKDFNFCDRTDSYSYMAVSMPDLSKNISTVELVHKAGILPNLTVTFAQLI